MTLNTVTHPIAETYEAGKSTIGEYEYRVPISPTPKEKFCPFLSIVGQKRLCDWRECGAARLCRGS